MNVSGLKLRPACNGFGCLTSRAGADGAELSLGAAAQRVTLCAVTGVAVTVLEGVKPEDI
jgi:hypothetical protein